MAATTCSMGRRTSHAGQAHHHDDDKVLCDNTLTQLLSWLSVPELAGAAGLVCKRWYRASECKEVWRSRMHPRLLKLFSDSQGPAALIGAAGDRYSPARLFKAVYCCNLLRNGDFLERTNSTRAHAGGSTRSMTWLPTHNGKGLSWEYPLLDASLPLPPASATHLGGDGAPSPSACRTSSAAIDIKDPARRSHSNVSGSTSGSSCGCGSLDGSSSLGAASSSPGSSPGTSSSFGLGSFSGSGSSRPAGPFAVGCVAPSNFMWSELAQVVDLSEALQAQSGMPADLAAAVLSCGALVEFSVWIAGSGGGGARGRGAAAGGSSAACGECQVIVGLVPAADAARAAVEGFSPEMLATAVVPFGCQLRGGVEPAEAQRLASEAAASSLATMGLAGTVLDVRGPFAPPKGRWEKIACRMRLPALTPCGALEGAPKLVVALRGRSGTLSAGLRASSGGPKFMAARVSFVPLDDE